MLLELLDSAAATTIPAPKAIHSDVIDFGLNKKRPFSSKNSVADAVILFATARWARSNPNEQCIFHTLNFRDFSDPKVKTSPHADIAHIFAPPSNLKYSYELNQLLETLAPLDPHDFYDRDPDGCTLCGEKVTIDEISCASCGHWPTSAPDDEGYTLKRHRGGQLVDVHTYEGETFRLECDECGRRTFEVYLNSLCSYHDHMTSKDRN